MDIASLPLVLRTARHLKPSQCAARLWRQVKRQWPLRKGLSRLGPAPPVNRQFVGEIVPLLTQTSTLDGVQVLAQLENQEIQLLNQRRPFDPAAPHWRLGRCDQDRLWTVTLHYHEWIYALADAATHGNEPASLMLRGCLADWISQCGRPCDGADALAWNAYAIATRLEWWIRTVSLLGESYWTQHPELWQQILNSLWHQAYHLSRNIEWDLRANHLLRDAIGLAWAGRFFSGPLPDKWMQTATQLAVSQADEQVMLDGGHFERSPMYHLEVMEDFEKLSLLLSDVEARQAMQDVHRRMSEFAVWMSHPDDCIPQLNDSARRRVQSSQPRPTGGRHFTETGLIVWHGDPWCVFFDVGKVGPDYQPGHAHADTLSVECSYAGQRLFVDPGCYSYDNDQRRRYNRATVSHNTVCIDDADSSEVWHIFRVGRRARPHSAVARFTRQTMHAESSHDGYQYLHGHPEHHRTVSVDSDNTLRIAERIAGSGRHTVAGGYLLEPCWQVESVPDGWRLRTDSSDLTIRIQASQPLVLSTESQPVHPQFGVEVKSRRLCWRYEGDLPLHVDIVVSGTEVARRLNRPFPPVRSPAVGQNV